jgi:hypothetical protein
MPSVLASDGDGTELPFARLRQYAFTEGTTKLHKRFGIPDLLNRRFVQIPDFHL